MSIRQSLGKLFDSVESKFKSQGAPPIPFATKPSLANQQDPQLYTYWSPLFDGKKSISDYFNYETGQHGWGNDEVQNYTEDPNNSFFNPSGQLVLRAIVRSASHSPQEKYTSARLTSHQRLSRNQGCLTVRLTAPCARGVWPAFWLLPGDPFQWPNDGEVDIFEAWNGDRTNHTCLHWGHFNDHDWDKHRVVETPIPNMSKPYGQEYSFVWQQPDNGVGGRLLWCIDGQPVMKSFIPQGTRAMSDWRIVINVAMGGNVCQGAIPADGTYDLVIHSIRMSEQPLFGWHMFDSYHRNTKEGHKM